MIRKSILNNKSWYNTTNAILFLLPSFLLLAVFVFWPMIYSLVLSFYDWNPLKGQKYIGLENFITLMKDKLWWTSLINTFYYIVLNVPLIIVTSIGLALIVVSLGKGSKVFRAVYFIPTLLSLVATGIVWQWLLSTNYGIVNGILGKIGIAPVKWFSSSGMAMISIVIVTVWRWAGYFMVIFIAALENISLQYYEAAELDGATWWQRFRFVTFPFLYPTIFFVSLMTIIGSFQEFDLFYMITLGGPGTSTYVTGFYMWQAAFSSMKMGYASAMSTILFIIVLVFTVIQNRIGNNNE